MTFLFSDIEGSTRLIERLGDEYVDVLEQHRAILRASVEQRGGTVVDAQGDSVFAAFPRPADAVLAAFDAQRALAANKWPAATTLRVRMGIHTGEAITTDTGYVGMEVHRAARIMAAGHGGQVLVSGETAKLLAPALPDAFGLTDLGEHRLKDMGRPEHLFQLAHPSWTPSSRPQRRSACGPTICRPRSRASSGASGSFARSWNESTTRRSGC